MTTSGVQLAGPRSVKVTSVGARTGNRAAGGTSFSDMMSVGASSQKASSSAQTKVERAQESRAQTANTPSEKPEAVSEKEVVKTPKTVQETKENPDGFKGEKPEGKLPEEPVLAGDFISEDSGENPGFDTGFVKS